MASFPLHNVFKSLPCGTFQDCTHFRSVHGSITSGVPVLMDFGLSLLIDIMSNNAADLREQVSVWTCV